LQLLADLSRVELIRKQNLLGQEVALRLSDDVEVCHLALRDVLPSTSPLLNQVLA
jgi:hypothetical protein